MPNRVRNEHRELRYVTYRYDGEGMFIGLDSIKFKEGMRVFVRDAMTEEQKKRSNNKLIKELDAVI